MPVSLSLLFPFSFNPHVLTIRLRAFSAVNCFQVDLLRRTYSAEPSAQESAGSPTSPTSQPFPTSPGVSEADTVFSQFTSYSEAMTVVAPDLVSPYEMRFFYNGISSDPPRLLWRSDLETNPFPVPAVGDRFPKIPTKTAYGAFNTPLSDVWDDTVAPRIIASMKTYNIKYSALQTARFGTVFEENGEEVFGPVVVWIAVHPNTTNAGAVRDFTPNVLHILNDAQITGVVVEWIEGTVERLDGLPLMELEEDNASATFGLTHPFNVGLGIPIARRSDGAQGTATLLFKEVKTKDGEPSSRILALTNKHVASVDTTTNYDFDEADPHIILVCGDRRFDLAFGEIKEALNTGFRDALKLAGELEMLEIKYEGQDHKSVQRKRTALEQRHEDNATLQDLFDEVDQKWRNEDNRRLGEVHWAPKIAVRVDDRNFTLDAATVAVDEDKLKKFTRNIVDLGMFLSVSS